MSDGTASFLEGLAVFVFASTGRQGAILAERFYRAVSTISAAAGVLAAVILVYILAHMIYEIILRGFFDSSTFVLDEFVGYGVAAMTFLAFGHALERGALIRVDLAIGAAKGWYRRMIELICIVASFGMASFCLYWVGRNALRDWSRGTVSNSIAEVPLWIPKGLVVLGVAIFLLQLFAYFIRILAGGPTVDEEATARRRAENGVSDDPSSSEKG